MESIQRFGFCVVGYDRRYAKKSIGERTNVLWRFHRMPVTFTVLRVATDAEWEEQKALFFELYGKRATTQETDTPHVVPMVLVTD